MRKIPFANNHIYHIYNRGVEKREIFLDKKDYFRFIHDLFEFNDETPAGKFSDKSSEFLSEMKFPTVKKPKRTPLVEILCFCLMPNHFHLLLRQVVENGITNFMHKVGTGYTMYFNQKFERTGSLFQGPFKAVLVKNDAYFLHLSRYIHLNPVELIEPNWKREGIINWDQANKFLESYRWSSYLDYIGIKNFPFITNRELLNSIFPNSEDYKKFTTSWLVTEMLKIKDLILE